MKIIHLSIYITVFSLVACVPGRKYEELKAKQQTCTDELAAMKAKYQNHAGSLADMEVQYAKMQKEHAQMEDERDFLQKSLKVKEGQYDKINTLYEELLALEEKRGKITASENEKILNELQKAQGDLQKKEDKLRAQELSLNNLKADLDSLKAQLDAKEKALEEREKKVNDLQAVIARKDSAVNQLKNTVADALFSFKDKGLTVEERNGKVYVSMEAKLLFASGSINVDNSGKQALIQLAKALEGQNDLEINVEGHTDTDALRSSSHPKDNWELSVLRATSVVKIMLENSTIDSKIISASGRSEFIPLNPSDKAKNRRIEVILTPNLAELYKVISE